MICIFLNLLPCTYLVLTTYIIDQVMYMYNLLGFELLGSDESEAYLTTAPGGQGQYGQDGRRLTSRIMRGLNEKQRRQV